LVLTGKLRAGLGLDVPAVVLVIVGELEVKEDGFFELAVERNIDSARIPEIRS
jgi:hypothetical protein